MIYEMWQENGFNEQIVPNSEIKSNILPSVFAKRTPYSYALAFMSLEPLSIDLMRLVVIQGSQLVTI